MIVSIHQPHFLPWLGYWNKVLSSDVFVWLDSVQYRKNYYQNRTLIKNVNGKPLWLTLPVHAHLGTRISEVTIADPDWQTRIWRTAEQCYGKTPFFQRSWPPIAEAMTRASQTLNDVNARAFHAVLDLLGAGDLRVTPVDSLPVSSTDPTERLVEACRALGAKRYIAGRGGRNYLRVEEFDRAGIEVIWQDFDPLRVVYEQGEGPFLPGLSVIDSLFHVGPSATRDLIHAAWSP